MEATREARNKENLRTEPSEADAKIITKRIEDLIIKAWVTTEAETIMVEVHLEVECSEELLEEE